MTEIFDRELMFMSAKFLQKNYDGLRMFRALETQDRIFTSDASELLIRGANRSGKTISAAIRFAAIVRDIPVMLSDGTLHDCRMPWQKDRPLLTWVIGKNWEHIGATIWRVLFRPGLYKIVKDPILNRWRAFDPVADRELAHLTKPSFPLIPFSEIKGGMDGIGWENKKERQFSRIELTNNTVISAYASTGEVKEGDPVDEIWIDEKLENPGHYGEYMMRRPDVKGRLAWSSLSRPDPKLIEVSRRAEEQKREFDNSERKKIDCEEIKLRYLENPFIDEEEKEKSIESLSEDERVWRVDGEFFIGNLLIYPTFSRITHSAIKKNPHDDDAISLILRERGGEPPLSWTREMILDPGTVKPAVLFAAIPPQTMMWRDQEVTLWENNEPTFVVYNEIYVPRQTAGEIADKILKKTSAGVRYERFIIDGQAARQTPMGYAGTIGSNYSKEFSVRGLACAQTGSGFVCGDPNFVTAQQLVDILLAVRTCGTPRLRVVIDKCPFFVSQMEGNLRAVDKGLDGSQIPLDKPATRQKDDLRRCLEYWVSRTPEYALPPEAVHVESPAERMFKKLQSSRKGSNSQNKVHIGPGKAA